MAYMIARTWICAVVSVLVALMISVALSAPVSPNNIEGIKQALKTQLKDQEQALESLATLTNKADSSGLEVSKLKSLSYSNINGAEDKLEHQEEKVSEPLSSKLISDLAETVEQSKASPDAVPQTSFDASVDIPAQGVHKHISSDGAAQESEELADEKDTIAFTPEIVAEYLRGEGKVEEFQDLMNELVNNAEISPEEAEQYEKSVMEAYYGGQNQKRDDFDVDMPGMDTLYPQGYADESQPIFPFYNTMPFPDKGEMYPMGYDEAPIVPGTGQLREEGAADEYPVSLDDMINYLLNEWLTRAIVTGDPEAGEILSNIVDYVSRDNDPNDEEQVKAILGDIIAETLLEDLMPRMESQQMPDFDTFRESAKQNVPVFPFPMQQQQQQQQQFQQQQQQFQQQQLQQLAEDNTTGDNDSTDDHAELIKQEPEQSSEPKDDLEQQLKM